MKKIIIIIVIIAVAGFLGYTFFGTPDEPEAGLVRGNNSLKVGAELLAALATLDSLRLDTEFFKDPTFRRLVNFSRDIPQQPKGRSNPFAPIGSSNLPATTTNAQ